jgi:hypothetical protein
MAEHTDPVRHVAESVSSWIVDTETLLAQAQTALESLRYHENIPRDVQSIIYQLLVLLRQRRGQVPTADMVRIWVKSVLPPSAPGGK